MDISEGVLAVWAAIGVLALSRVWNDPARRAPIIGALAVLAAAGAAATGLWQFAHDSHEWTEATLALGGMSGTIVLTCLAKRREEGCHGM